MLYSEDNKRVVGVATGDVGLDKERKATENFARGSSTMFVVVDLALKMLSYA